MVQRVDPATMKAKAENAARLEAEKDGGKVKTILKVGDVAVTGAAPNPVKVTNVKLEMEDGRVRDFEYRYYDITATGTAWEV